MSSTVVVGLAAALSNLRAKNCTHTTLSVTPLASPTEKIPPANKEEEEEYGEESHYDDDDGQGCRVHFAMWCDNSGRKQ